ncbi:MAG TPA: HlyD family efflux transporter periplasmic adaptor subunit [Acidovorax defluvii]|nr:MULTISPECIES: HlyD family efflux transporter periplasmic adaptor subunit [unclassified Acidovorax]HQS20984.1 HlyD family efflux transporter periplasmic adaptor subunit [Acidovorax defluvii]OYY26749.1 MAG: efflux transporter periplasmic adaptor subunit [Acidovorax sp. 35-64-16]OZA68446.1 MAG: efflux transporter periplasmic adaptor subunit [Acidovorax sp. 39-64-12]HQS62768.1 HlyD family efflux transporter periplasmic adaptor subunit [Acidovorax defluvii]HQT18970.1 HlyD family efflux transport
MAMQKKTLMLGVGALVVLGALLAWAFAPRPLQVEATAVVQGRFEAGIDEDAKTRLRDRFSISAPLAGRLARIALREGDAVQAGDVVARITPAMPALLDERSLREQQARVTAAQANVQRAAVRIERSRVAQAQARNDLRRSEQLAQQGFVAPTRLDSERLALQAAEKDTDAAVQEQQVARAALDVVQRPGSAPAGKAFEVLAPVAGRVLRVAQVSESVVALGTVLVEVGDTAQLEVVAPLLSTDALQVRPGSPVRIERWGGPGVLQGRVRSVEPAAFTKVSALGVEEQRVNVLIDLTSPPAQWAALGDGYRVVARVLTREAPDATLVPVSALFPLPVSDGAASAPMADAAAPRMAVFVVEGGRARRTPVVLEARGSTHAWVKEGLQAGDQGVVYPPAALTDGARVQLRTP